MSKLNISEASRAIGKPRSTIQRNIKKGVLSAEKDATDRTVIDVSELQRVFGKLDMDAVAGEAELNRSNEQSDTGRHEAELELLRVKLAYTERERDELQRREREQGQQHQGERERLLGIIETQTIQIKELAALPKSVKEPEPELKRGFWQRIFN